jgi:oligopeptidase B
MNSKLILTIFIISILVFACEKEPVPPSARIEPDTLRIHDSILIDDYAWLKDKTRSNPEILEYVIAENEYTEKEMLPYKKLQNDIYYEMINRLIEDDESVPVEKNGYFYYSRNEKGRQYRVFCRKKGNLDAAEEIYLDMNLLAQDFPFLSIYDRSISPDHRYLAYGVDTTGSEIYDLRIKDLHTGEYFSDTVSGANEIVWANDNSTIFYALQDDTGRSNRIFRHKLGADVSEDKLIYSDDDEKFWVWVGKSRNQKFITLGSGSKTTSEIWFLPADDPTGDFTVIAPRQQGVRYYPLFHDNELFIVTNENAPNKKVMKTTINRHNRKYWKEFIPTNDSIKIEADCFQNHLVITERSKGLKSKRILNLTSLDSHYIDFDEPVYSVYHWYSTAYNSSILRYTYESLTTPYSVYDYNMDTGKNVLMQQDSIPGGYDPLDYKADRFFATSRDGSLIPISMVYKKDKFQKDGTTPIYLTAYGAYGDSFDPYFSTARLSLLNRGVIFAIAQVRGGGDMGEYWYEQGKMLNKKNTFYDFIDCSEFLIENKYTSSNRFIINGGSAGGLLIGAVINMRPELYLGAIADVPFVDIIYTMLDPTLSAVVSEYEEWGNPNIQEEFEYILSYAPYNNVTEQEYPHILALAGFYDTRVNYWESAKWVAKLRAKKTDENLLLLQTNMNAGHGGSSGRYDYLEEVALIYSFVFRILDK